jgi:two-component system, cell cycle response regulator CpdR
LDDLHQSAEEAQQLLGLEPVDVLFADAVMSALNGSELAKRAKRLRPNLKIMFMTGYYSRAAGAEKLGKLLFRPLRETELVAQPSDLLASN